MRLQGEVYSPVQLSAFILQKMKATAEDYLGETVSECVITVPANFNDDLRFATLLAAKIAGLKARRIINEPTAASLYYGVDYAAQTIAVFDLGGGTFDISVLDVGDGVFEVLSTGGDTFLGGQDFDYALVDDILTSLESQSSARIDLDSIARLRLKQAAESSKIERSHSTKSHISLPFFATLDDAPYHLEKIITQSKFEELIEPLIERMINVCKRALLDAGKKIDGIDTVVLVGGSTRIPILNSKLQEFFRSRPYGALRREDAVALGAAIQGAVISGKCRDTVLLDVTPISLGTCE